MYFFFLKLIFLRFIQIYWFAILIIYQFQKQILFSNSMKAKVNKAQQIKNKKEANYRDRSNEKINTQNEQFQIWKKKNMNTQSNQFVKNNEKQDTSDYGDCSCQMMDTSLQGVGDSECSCSQCLEANLQAFNEFKRQQDQYLKNKQTKNNRGLSTKVPSNKQSRGQSKNNLKQQNRSNIRHFKSTDKMRQTRPNTSINRNNYFQSQNENFNNNQDDQISAPKFNQESINDFLIITQHRARLYMKQRKNLQKSQTKQRLELKNLIKQNLGALKYTSQMIVRQRSSVKEEQNQGIQQPKHSYKWNHPPYFCKSRVQCRKRIKYEPDLQRDKQQIQKIQKRIKQYKIQNKQKQYECPDRCPRHHMRTSPKKIEKIEKFIKKKAKQYIQAQKRRKRQKQQKQKIIEAKLRAIDLKCQQKLSKSKKYDPNIQRTSFHNSIDHFSTFSQLKNANIQRIQAKQKRYKQKIAAKDGKMMQQAIYQDIEEQLIGDHPGGIRMSLETQSRYILNKEKSDNQQQWCQKIVKDAKIKPPKDFKNDDLAKRQYKQQKKRDQKQKSDRHNKKSTKNISAQTLKKQQQRRKELQQQISRRKQQILHEFKKRNSNANVGKNNQIKNKPIRGQYESKNPNPSSNRAESSRYPQNYQNNPLKSQKQLQDKDLFTNNVKNLMQKQQIKI